MKFSLIIIALVSLVAGQSKYIGQTSKSFNIDNLSLNTYQSFNDTLVFLNGTDTLIAPYSGNIRITTPIPVDTLIIRDTLRIPFIVYDTVPTVIYKTVYVDSTLRPPVVNRWVLGGDTLTELSLDTCNYIIYKGKLIRKYSCK